MLKAEVIKDLHSKAVYYCTGGLFEICLKFNLKSVYILYILKYLYTFK